MPSEKRARQRAAREEKQAAIQRVRKRRRTTRRGLSMLVIAALIVGVVLLVSDTHGPKKKVAASSSTTTTTSTFPVPTTIPFNTAAIAPTCPSVTETKRIVWFTTKPPDCIPRSSVWEATFDTSVGSFVAKLPADTSYAAVNNFVFLVRWNYYNGTFFHRVIKGFMDQGGDPTGTGTGGPHGYPGYSFTGNTPPKSCTKKKDCYPTGSLAMANSGAPSSDGSQFFITVPGGGAELDSDPVYTDFGHVVSGLSVVEKINSYGAASTDETGTPKTKVYLLSVKVKETKV